MNLFSLLNKRQPLMKMFRRKQNNNRGVMWASLLSLAVSAAAYVLSRGQKQTNEGSTSKTSPLQNIVSNLAPKNNISLMNDAALTEYSEELISKAIQNK